VGQQQHDAARAPKQFGLRATMTDAEFAAVKKNLAA
jgi:hypothetical protein